MTLTERIEELLRLEAEATKGPWTLEAIACDIGCCDDLQEIMSPDDRPIGKVYGGNAVWLKAGEAPANAAGIAAARNIVPDLAAEYRAAIAERDKLAARETAVRAFCQRRKSPASSPGAQECAAGVLKILDQ